MIQGTKLNLQNQEGIQIQTKEGQAKQTRTQDREFQEPPPTHAAPDTFDVAFLTSATRAQRDSDECSSPGRALVSALRAHAHMRAQAIVTQP